MLAISIHRKLLSDKHIRIQKRCRDLCEINEAKNEFWRMESKKSGDNMTHKNYGCIELPEKIKKKYGLQSCNHKIPQYCYCPCHEYRYLLGELE